MKKISIFLLLILSLKVHAMRNPFEVDEAWFARIEAAPTTEWPQDFAQAPV